MRSSEKGVQDAVVEEVESGVLHDPADVLLGKRLDPEDEERVLEDLDEPDSRRSGDGGL